MSTTDVLVNPEIQTGAAEAPGAGGATLVRLLPASVVAYVWPRASRVWGSATLGRAFVVAGIHTASVFVWGYFMAMMVVMWLPMPKTSIPPLNPWVGSSYMRASAMVRGDIVDSWGLMGWMDRIALGGSVVMAIALAYAVPFFMLLPFAARPGNNKACMRHVLKTVLMGSGLVHWWGAAYFGVIFSYAALRMPQIYDYNAYARVVSPLLLVFAGLVVWHMGVLIHAARREYRRAADMPKAHDPWCDVCGYNLTGIDRAGRCPECGKLIEESLGAEIRPATAWERRPSVWNFGVIARQIRALIAHPRRLFYSMPTMSGQEAAQRWLWMSLGAIFLTAVPIVPAMYVELQADWNFAVVSGTLAMCVVWTGFGLMMVGIETGGIATFSKMKGHPGGGVYLAAAAKVTCYTAVLMVTWVLLGGAQLVIYTYCSTPPHDLFKLHSISYRWTQIILGGSLAIAHVGGLLWYELTVYRGVRAIQYASK